ncbi:hypothetical protein [Homoserinimonas hongtaonis]|uniref:Haloacid dehalogenase n=1 Tax=Homoserinimonas hongtaonis TaxID=2079791 RepID=A0A2U1SYF4_9MICO|nr:hypothetical protein [Salinibacterium hongtaonis]PWB96639.1 hypothetical protein DF220_01395 [Salinibacterium hongtaonis]
MPTTPPPLGLMLDVDGPIASPETRTIAIPEITADLVSLAAAGIPIAFITGRSEHFITNEVVAPLVAGGLPKGVRMFGVCEKGAVWFTIDDQGRGDVSVDTTVGLPAPVVAALKELVERDFSDAMFFDETKLAMVSVEQRTDVASAFYAQRQSEFEAAAFEVMAERGVGVRHGERESADSTGAVPFRIDTTIISTDIESVRLDKNHAAERALNFFAESGPLPRVWRSVGDSRGDYLMADHLHEAGFDAAHVDVRPSDGVLERPYPIIEIDDVIHDEAGARFLAYWVDKLGIR